MAPQSTRRILACYMILSCWTAQARGLGAQKVELNPMETLGQKIFSDTRLSNPQGQSCMTCHNPEVAFSDPRKALPISRGADNHAFGGRNTPSAMYMKFSKPLELVKDDQTYDYVGGYFWDGRANSLEEQAKGPFLNPLEMGETKDGIVKKVCSSTDYSTLFKKLFGDSACEANQIESSYDLIAKAIAGFESTSIFSPFTSKFDKVMAGKTTFTETELRGFNLFKDPKKANCAACHLLDKDESAGQALLTDFTYDNIGLPESEEMNFFGHDGNDIGLMATTHRAEDLGRFKVPTLRNIALTAPYMHNGYLRTLKQVVDFYNTRDTKSKCATNLNADEATEQNCWPHPANPETTNHDELGNLGLTQQETQDLIEFMNTLTDGYWTTKSEK